MGPPRHPRPCRQAGLPAVSSGDGVGEGGRGWEAEAEAASHPPVSPARERRGGEGLPVCICYEPLETRGMNGSMY
jgi:hypothetical protein